MYTLWIDALEFEQPGGWIPETQFSHEMGQGYLMASGVPGEPVANASTSFTIHDDGMYRFWVRTKNWLPSSSPGRFRVLVDDDRIPRELGKLPISGWCWEAAGDVALASGSHKLTIEDTSGWFTRFAAVIITNDMNYTPSPEKEMIWRERADIRGESTEPVRDNTMYDLIVAGAGPAGIPAAVAAARKGLKVCLIHSRPVIGGNASDEATVCFDGAAAPHPGMRETGIADEIRRIKDFRQTTWQAALEELINAESNITLHLNQFVISATTRNHTIETITTLNVINSQRTVYKGKLFADCTGDGWLGYYAGAKYRLGREARWQHNESLAPLAPDNHSMSGCLMGTHEGKHALCYSAVETDDFVSFTAPDWAIKLPDGDDLHRTPSRLIAGEWWVENPTDMDDLWQQEFIRDELIRLSLGYFHWLKNSYAKRDLAAKLKLVSLPRYNAKRETRRLIGDYILTQEDVTKVTVFDDAISYCGWPMDVHHPRGLFSGKEGPYYSNTPVPITSIPYRCLYSININNLFMAGRCASVTHLALGTIRVQSTLATLGQAVGTAAAICIQKNIFPRDVYDKHIKLLQQTLLSDDQSIPWLRNEDERDHARHAQPYASSESQVEVFSQELGLETGWDELDRARGATVNNQTRIPDHVRVKLKSTLELPTELRCELIDMSSGGFEKAPALSQCSITIQPGFEGIIDLPLQLAAPISSIGLRISECKGVYWRKLDYTSFRRTRAYRLNRYHWITDSSNSYYIDLDAREKPKADCSAANVINGINRAISPEQYAWVSDPKQALPQYIALKWDHLIAISRVALTFDTDSMHPAFAYLSLPVVEKTVKAFDIQAMSAGKWVTVASVNDNFLRHVTCSFDTVHTNEIRAVIRETHGCKSARVFEMRAYT